MHCTALECTDQVLGLVYTITTFNQSLQFFCLQSRLCLRENILCVHDNVMKCGLPLLTGYAGDSYRVDTLSVHRTGPRSHEQCYFSSENKFYFNSYFSFFSCNIFSSNSNFSYQIIPNFNFSSFKQIILISVLISNFSSQFDTSTT